MTKPIPRPSSDITYSCINTLRVMPGYSELKLGWNNLPKETFYITQCERGVRCQHWHIIDAKALILDILDTVGLNEFCKDLAAWAEKQFPGQSAVGKLRHLSDEVDEVIDDPDDIFEYADCFNLLMDAGRVKGFTPDMILKAARQKLEINKNRVWPPFTDIDEPCHHVEEEIADV